MRVCAGPGEAGLRFAPVRASARRPSPRAVASRAVRTEEAEADAPASSDDVAGVVRRPDMFTSDLETTLMRGSPPLHRAARWGDVARVRQLLLRDEEESSPRSRPLVDERDVNGSTPLMWASQFGHDDVVKVLLDDFGADPNLINAFGWTAAEYASTSSAAGDVLPLILAAGAPRDATRVVPSAMLGGGHGRLLCDFTPNRIPAPVGPKGPARWANLLTGLRRRYARSASQSARDAWRAPAVVEVGGVAVAGCTFKPLGLYAGQRYEIVRLFLRDGVTGEEVDVEQVSSHTSSPPGFEPGTSHAPTDSTSWELCATVRNPTWTPWGVSEVGVEVAELRSVRDELAWASRVAAGAGAFWLSVAFICSNDLVSLTSIPSESMAPGVRRGDLMLVDRRRPPVSRAESSDGTSINRGTVGGFGVGDVVLFEPPPALREIAARNGTPLRSGEYFVKRIVAVGGDEVEVVDGVLFRNGRREASYPTGTPVGVGRNGPTSDETHDGGTCDACKFGRYDLSRRVVPAGSFLVLGDNRGGSNDGHVWGYLPEKNVLGKISFRVAPLNRAGFLREAPVGEERDGER